MCSHMCWTIFFMVPNTYLICVGNCSDFDMCSHMFSNNMLWDMCWDPYVFRHVLDSPGYVLDTNYMYWDMCWETCVFGYVLGVHNICIGICVGVHVCSDMCWDLLYMYWDMCWDTICTQICIGIYCICVGICVELYVFRYILRICFRVQKVCVGICVGICMYSDMCWDSVYMF